MLTWIDIDAIGLTGRRDTGACRHHRCAGAVDALGAVLLLIRP